MYSKRFRKDNNFSKEKYSKVRKKWENNYEIYNNICVQMC